MPRGTENHGIAPRPRNGKRSNVDARALREVDLCDDSTKESRKPKRRVSFSDKAQIREFPKYLNSTDSSAECSSDASRRSNDANVTINETVNMSICEESFMRPSIACPLSDMTQLVMRSFEGEIPSDPKASGEKTEGSLKWDVSMAKVDASIFAPTLGRHSVTERSVEECHVPDESLPRCFPYDGRSFCMAELSRTNVTDALSRDESEIMIQDSEMPSIQLELDWGPKFSADHGRRLAESLSTEEGIHEVIPLENTDLEYSVDASLGAMGGASMPLAESRMACETGFMDSCDLRAPEPSESWEEALNRAASVEDDIPVPAEEIEAMLTSHRKSLDLIGAYRETVRNAEGLADVTLDELEASAGRAGVDSLSEGEQSEGEPEAFSLQELKSWLSDWKRKFRLDDDEIVEEKQVCCRRKCHFVTVQLWTTVFEHVSHSASQKFHRCLDLLTSSKQNLDGSHRMLEESILEATKGEKPDVSSPVVMVTRKKRTELEERKADFFDRVHEFSKLMAEYLDYDIRCVDEARIVIGIRGSWVIRFTLDGQALDAGVVEVTGVESDLMSRCSARLYEILGERSRVRREHVLEHLLRNFLPEKHIRDKVKDLKSVVEVLDELSAIHGEASRIASFMERINPCRVDDIWRLSGKTLTFTFFESTSGLRFSIATTDFELPSLFQSGQRPAWKISKYCGYLREKELEFTMASVKMDASYYESLHGAVSNWLKSLSSTPA